MIELPARPGAKPKTSAEPPHQQLDQNPPERAYTLLKSRAFDFPHVDRRPSAISVSLGPRRCGSPTSTLAAARRPS